MNFVKKQILYTSFSLLNIMEKKKIYSAIIKKLKTHDIKSISVFGSYARNEEHKGSDIDLIVEFNEVKSLLELVGIEQDLEEITGKKIDLLTKKAISPYLIDQIKREMVKIY